LNLNLRLAREWENTLELEKELALETTQGCDEEEYSVAHNMLHDSDTFEDRLWDDSECDSGLGNSENSGNHSITDMDDDSTSPTYSSSESETEIEDINWFSSNSDTCSTDSEKEYTFENKKLQEQHLWNNTMGIENDEPFETIAKRWEMHSLHYRGTELSSNTLHTLKVVPHRILTNDRGPTTPMEKRTPNS
jgi:hypothetical protein